jgi:hypothetical protein
MPMRILSGWKQIANYMQAGVRTVQRWEQVFGLPVHRPKAGARGAVIAFAEELESWGQMRPVRLDVIAELKAQVETLEAEVLHLRSQLAAEQNGARRHRPLSKGMSLEFLSTSKDSTRPGSSVSASS